MGTAMRPLTCAEETPGTHKVSVGHGRRIDVQPPVRRLERLVPVQELVAEDFRKEQQCIVADLRLVRRLVERELLLRRRFLWRW